MTDKTKLIRTIYLYLFSLVGLVLVIIAGVRFIDMGLKAWVFTQAEQDQRNERPMPMRFEGGMTMTDDTLAKKILECDASCDLSAEEKTTVKEWISDYAEWKENYEKIDYVVQQRHRDAASSLAQLIIGLPLYMYHWRMATRKRKEEE